MASGPSDHSLKIQLHIQDVTKGILGKLKGEFGILGSAVHLVTDMFKNFNKAIIGISLGIGLTVILAMIKLIKMIFTLNEHIAIMGQRFGMSRGQIKEFNAQLFLASARAGIMVDQTTHMANALMEAGFKGRRKELADLSATLFQFSAVTGISAEAGAEFAAELSKMGYNTDKLLKQLASLRLTLQQLSTKEFESLIKTMQKAADILFIFGNRSDDAVLGVGKLVGMMVSLKASAEDASDMIMSLMDPLKWKENKVIKLLGYGVAEQMKIMTHGFEDSTDALIDMTQRVKNWWGTMSETAKYSLIMSGTVTQQQAKLFTQMLDWRTEDIEKMRNQIDTTKDLNKSYMDMGEILEPLRKKWVKLLSESMPLIKDLVRYLGVGLDLLTEFSKWISTHGGGKTLLWGLLGIGGLGILASIVGWLVNISVTAAVTAAALAAAGVAGTTAGVGIVGGLTAASIAGTTLLAILGSIGMGLVYIAGAAALVFVVWKAIQFAKKSGLDFSYQMANVLNPIMAAGNWAAAFGVKLSKSMTGRGGVAPTGGGTAGTDNINQITSQAAARADQKIDELMKNLLEHLQTIAGNTGTQNNLTQGLVGVIKHESATDRERRIAEEARNKSVYIGGQ